MDKRTTVFIADSGEEFCAGLTGALLRADGYQVVGTASDGEQAIRQVEKLKPDMLVLDELCLAVDIGMISLEKVMEFLNERHRAEIVITGRKPPQELLDRADYVTEMKKVKHPYDKGRSARTGIEW